MSNAANLEIRRLHTCSFEQALEIWNEGFAGYPLDLTLTLDRYLARLTASAISPEHSLVGFHDGKPVGFVLNAIGSVAGRKIAWNGGTGVSREYRRHGVAKTLMAAAIDLYGEMGVEIATLEAIKENETAISLYRRFGYEVVDELVLLSHDAKMDSADFPQNLSGNSISEVSPGAVSRLGFYQATAPWQVQAAILNRSKCSALVVRNADGEEVGYALYQKLSDDKGVVAKIVLYQCVVRAKDDGAPAVVAAALQHVYAPLEVQCARSTHNLSKSNEVVIAVLEELGFKPVVEQVQMSRRFP